MAEQLAIMKGVSYRMWDIGYPRLFFSVYVVDCVSAPQVLFGADVDKVIKDADARDIRDLEGRTCWVETGGGTTKFLRIVKT